MQNLCQTWGPSEKNRKELDDDSVGTIQVPNHAKTKRRTIPKNKNRKTDKYLGYLFTKQQFFLQNWFDEVEDFKRENINPFK